MNLTEGITYNFMVDATNAFKANSSFVFQIHADIHNVSLTNTSKACNITRECQQNGKNVGLVQLLYSGVNPIANFSVCYSCATNNSGCSTKQEVLVAVAGIAIKGMYRNSVCKYMYVCMALFLPMYTFRTNFIM